MDPISIVKDTARGHNSVHRRTDGQGETNTPPFNFVEAGKGGGGYNKFIW